VRAIVAVLVIAASLSGAVALNQYRTGHKTVITHPTFGSFVGADGKLREAHGQAVPVTEPYRRQWIRPLTVFVAAAGTGVGLVILSRKPR
jgi:hypothetical protein